MISALSQTSILFLYRKFYSLGKEWIFEREETMRKNRRIYGEYLDEILKIVENSATSAG